MPYRYFPYIIAFAGALLRCLWPADMEWKFDEQEMFRLAGEAWKHGLPLMGMPSGAGLPNAGFSIWPFALLYGIHPSPLFMGIGVQVINVLALCLMLHCASRYPEPLRRNLLWGLASYAVSLMPVLFSRKIWAQDLLPLFIATLWWCYLNKHRAFACILAGLCCAFAGQLHLSGFFYAGGFITALLVFKQFSKKQWMMMMTGGLTGLLPGIPWIQAVLEGGGGISHLNNIVKMEFWLRIVTDTPGFNMHYSANGELTEFMPFPSGTHLPIVIALFISAGVLLGLYQTIRKKAIYFHFDNPILFLMAAFVIFPGIWITLSGIPVRSHYMIGALPFCAVALTMLWKNIRLGSIRPLIWLVIMQFAFTILFMAYVHQKQSIKGDYGQTYRLQTKNKNSPL